MNTLANTYETAQQRVDFYLGRSMLFTKYAAEPSRDMDFFEVVLDSFRMKRINRKLEKVYSNVESLLPVHKSNFEYLHNIYTDVRDLRNDAPKDRFQEMPSFLKKEMLKSLKVLEKIEALLEDVLFVDLRQKGLTEAQVQAMREKFRDWSDWDSDEMDAYYGKDSGAET